VYMVRDWEKFRKILGLYISLLLLIMISITIYIYREFLMYTLLRTYGLAGLSFLSFVSCLSIVPIPYMIVVFRVAPYVNPLITALVVGIASALGEAVAWVLGRASSQALSGSIYVKRVNALLKFAERKGSIALPLLAFIFSLTFLPDKALYLPLGIVRYSLWRLLPFTVLGKILMTYLTIVLGRLWYEVVGPESDIVSFVVTTVLLAIMMTLLIIVDWEKVLEKKLS
jgi:membrane protein YqaA with SNARE-associated domain